MKSIFDANESEKIIQRINDLKIDNKNLWGKMTVNQMLCHVSDPIRDILGIRKTEPVTPPEIRPQIKAMVMVEEEWGRNFPTFPPYSQEEGGGGTKPTNFEDDRKKLIQLLSQFLNSSEDFAFHPHAGLGMLTKAEFGEFIWKHTDHHLREFGV